MNKIISLSLFVLVGLCEIGGGYLIWLWLREGNGMALAFGRAILLATYGNGSIFKRIGLPTDRIFPEPLSQ